MKIYNLKKDKYSSHQLIAQLVASQKFSHTKILDLGCDVGFLGQSLKMLGNSQLHGADINRKNLMEAQRYYSKLFCFDLNNEKWPIKEKYEIVVLADTLEHLYRPDKVIKQVLTLLKDGGILILSVPNSVFLWARLKIMMGNFPKDERGLFDKTHLHFFTQQTLRHFLNQFSELTTEQELFTTVPFQFILKNYTQLFPVRIFYEALFLLAQSFPTVFSYQFIIVGKKRTNI